jgi:hypothetical protein
VINAEYPLIDISDFGLNAFDQLLILISAYDPLYSEILVANSFSEYQKDSYKSLKSVILT